MKLLEPKTATEEKISVYDIMKDVTSKIIQKLESQAPIRFQQYSDPYFDHASSPSILCCLE